MVTPPNWMLLTILSTLLACGTAHAQEQPLWKPDTFDPGIAPRISLPSTTGVPVGGSFSGNLQSTAPSEVAQPKPQPSPAKATETSANAQNGQKQPEKSSGAASTTLQPSKPPIDPKTALKPNAVEKKYVNGMVLTGSAVVLDGHSLNVNGHPVRLNGIEAPGLAQMCNTATMTVWPCGVKSAQRLVQLINNDLVTCQVKDQAGHGAAAVCGTRSIRDLGKMLVSEGFAVPNGQGAAYGSISLSAQKARKGMFVGSFVHPIRWRKLNP